ncbi:MAG: hypothetical protein ACRD2W_04045 [Acidimicrobiales bacterium]
MRGRRRALIGALALLVAVGAGWTVYRPALSRRQDVAARRLVYRSYPMFPGATKVGERSYEIEGDGVGTGEYGLNVTYRLPATATPSNVIGFFRQNMPPGWHEATDETCAGVAARMPPPPIATVPGATGPVATPTTAFAGRLVLLRREGELAVFAPDTRDGEFKGVTFKVFVHGRAAFLTLDGVSFACEPG